MAILVKHKFLHVIKDLTALTAKCCLFRLFYRQFIFLSKSASYLQRDDTVIFEMIFDKI